MREIAPQARSEQVSADRILGILSGFPRRAGAKHLKTPRVWEEYCGTLERLHPGALDSWSQANVLARARPARRVALGALEIAARSPRVPAQQHNLRWNLGGGPLPRDSQAKTQNYRNIGMLIHTLEEGGRYGSARAAIEARTTRGLADKFV